MLGQDRYRRRFWILAQNGGIYVESLESAEQDGLGDFDADMLSATDGTEQEEINDESGPASDMVSTGGPPLSSFATSVGLTRRPSITACVNALLQEEDDDGSQESKKAVGSKKETTDKKAEVTKTEDEAPDHDKENEVKTEALNEMPDIKTEAKAEPEDKATEDKVDPAVVNGETTNAKDEVEDCKKVEIKEDAKPKTEQAEGELSSYSDFHQWQLRFPLIH